jgi:hypothetical protein
MKLPYFVLLNRCIVLPELSWWWGPHALPALLYDVLWRLELFVGKNWKYTRKFGWDSWLCFCASNTTRSEYVVHSIEMWPHAYIIICAVHRFLTNVAPLFPHHASPPPILFSNVPPSFVPHGSFCSNGPPHILSCPGKRGDFDVVLTRNPPNQNTLRTSPSCCCPNGGSNTLIR